jgi:hypothetical protein
VTIEVDSTQPGDAEFPARRRGGREVFLACALVLIAAGCFDVPEFPEGSGVTSDGGTMKLPDSGDRSNNIVVPLDSGWDGRPDGIPADVSSDVDALTMPRDTGADTVQRDMNPGDMGSVDMMTPTDEGMNPVDTGPDQIPPVDMGTPATPPRGAYTYQKVPVGGLKACVDVAFHPSGDFFLVLERSDRVHLIQSATLAVTTFDLGPTQGYHYWEDIEFDPTGNYALIGGYRSHNGAHSPVLYRFDMPLWIVAQDIQAFVPYATTPPGDSVAGIEFSKSGGDPVLMVRTKASGSGYYSSLYSFDATAETYTTLWANELTSAGCQDLAFVDNEYGDPGIAVSCGLNDADAYYYTTIGGVGESRQGQALGNSNFGNLPTIASHPSEAYALAANWSGTVFRFEAGQSNTSSQALRFSWLTAQGSSFQQDGRRALIFGRSGSVLEYRHDLYRCPSSGNCDLTDVSISNFSGPPYNASSNAYLNGADWRPGCDGGVVVAGDGSVGQVITFQVFGAVNCW